jgi:hypothetical protein
LSQLRRDVHVPNESDAFVIASAGQRGRGLMPGEAAWNAAVAACEVLPILVESEDPANVRVVVGGELDAAEQAEWVGRVSGGLRIPDGRLAVCGGAAYVLDKQDWTSAYARIVEIAPGDYRATIYCYASAPNGRLCLEQAGDDEPLGAWFRRTRPGQDMPVWLHNRCVNDPDLDPDERKRWKRAAEKRGGHVVDFLLHLEPSSEPIPPPTGDHGFAEAVDCRKPEVFPLGLAVKDVEGLEDDEETDDEEEVSAADVADVQSRTARFAPGPVIGGPVEVPLGKIARVARIAWMCHPYTQPTIRISFPQAVIDLGEVEDVVARRQGRELQLAFANTGQAAGAQDAMLAVAKQLVGLPDGCVIELDTARSGNLVGPRPVGLLRFRGEVAAGAWRIDAAFPPVGADLLREALAVAEALEAPRRLVARDDSEAQRIEARVAQHAADFFHANPLQRTGAELALRRRDPAALWQVAVRAFWLRYAGIFPLQDFDLQPPG